MSKKFLLSLFLFSVTSSFAQLTLTTSSKVNTHCKGVDCVYNGPSILINEIMLSPAGNIDGSLYGSSAAAPGDGEGEWIELYNPNECQEVDISCYMLGNAAETDAQNGTYVGGGYRIPNNTIVPPLGFVVIRGSKATAVPPARLVQNGGNTIELVVTQANVCIGPGGTRLWFPNAGSWFAFYDANGVPQDAVSWANQAGINNTPCNPSAAGCPNFNGALASYNAIPAARKTKIANVVTPNSNRTYKRVPDGQAWRINTETAPTQGTCNGPCTPPQQATCTGEVSVVVTGGTPPYKYLWNDNRAQKTATATKLCAGTYCVTVTDNAGVQAVKCVEVKDFKPVVVVSDIPDACIDGPAFKATGTPANGGPEKNVGVFSGPIAGNGTYTPASAGVGTHMIIYSFRDSSNCFNADTTRPEVFAAPDIKANADLTKICLGSFVKLTGTGPVKTTFQWNKGVQDNVAFAPNATDTYTVMGIDSNGCKETDSVKVEVVLPPKAGLDSSTIACLEADISLKNLQRNAQAAGVFKKDGNFAGTLNENSGQYKVPANLPPGNYSFFFIATADAPCKADTAIYTISIKDRPLINNLQTTCATNRQTYTVTFTITGGDPSSYAVIPSKPVSGPPYTYTSHPIPNNVQTNFTVSDKYKCGSSSVSTRIDCGCTTFSGTMKTDSARKICGPGSVDVKPFFNKDSVNDGNDLFRYYLHEADGNLLQNPIDANTTGIFTFKQGMTYGQKYYVSPVMADNKNGSPDLDDICLSVGRGLPVTWNEVPGLTLTSDTTLCSGTVYQLKFNMTKGLPPFSVRLQVDSLNKTSIKTLILNDMSERYAVKPTITSRYTVLSFTDANNCQGVVLNNTALVTVRNPVVASLDPVGDLCTDGKTRLASIRINVSGDEPLYRVVLSNSLNAAKDTIPVDCPGKIYNPSHFDPDQKVTLTIDTVLGTYPAVCSPTYADKISIYPYPTVDLKKDSTYCEGQPADLRLIHTGIGPWIVNMYNNQGGAYTFVTCNNRDTIHQVTGLSANNYTFTIDNVKDSTSGCMTTDDDSIKVIVNPSPKLKLVVMDGPTPAKSLTYCVGSGPATLRVDNFPDPAQTYQVSYMVLGTPNHIYTPLTMTMSGNTFQFDSVPGTYQVWLFNAKDNSTAGCGGVGDTVEITINPLPTLALSSPDTLICLGDSALVEARVTGNPPIAFQLNEINWKDSTMYTPSGTGTFSFYVRPHSAGMVNYKASLLRDGSSPQCSNVTNERVVFRVSTLPTAQLVDSAEWCQGSPFTVPVKVTGEAPVTVNFQYAGKDTLLTYQPPAGSFTDLLPPGRYPVTITMVHDNSPEQCVGKGTGQFIVIVRPTPTANLTFVPDTVCLGDPVQVEVRSTGNGPFSVNIMNDLNQNSTVTVNNGMPAILNDTARAKTYYTILDVSDNSQTAAGTCKADINQRYDLTVNGRPRVMLTGDTTVCPGVTSNLQFIFETVPPFTVDFSDGVGNFSSGPVNATQYLSQHLPKTEYSNVWITSLRDGNGCYATDLGDTLPIRILPAPLPDMAATDYTSCVPLYTRLINNTSNVPLASCSFASGGNSSTSLDNTLQGWSFPVAGRYDLTGTMTSTDGCSTSFVLKDFFIASPNPVADFSYSPVPATLVDNIIQLHDHSMGADFYYWTITDTTNTIDTVFTSANPFFEYQLDFPNILSVKLHVSTVNSCIDSISKTIPVLPELLMFAPNVFTPNGDKVNDSFGPVFSHPDQVLTYSLHIYNKWGERVFSTTDINERWDGTFLSAPVESDVYDWRITYQPKGKALKKELFGNVTPLY